jgi:transcriptional antiterminator NusG
VANQAGSSRARRNRPEVGESEERAWYVIHTYSGYENKVKANLEKRVDTMSMEHQIFEVLVPMQDEMEVKDGKKKLVQHKVFPGYVLVDMSLTDESWYVVRNTPGVTGFVGPGSRPSPLPPHEVEQVMAHLQAGASEEAVRTRIDFSAGQPVRLLSGAFAGFVGNVEEIDQEKAKVWVSVTMFGRETRVEVDADQLEEV